MDDRDAQGLHPRSWEDCVSSDDDFLPRDPVDCVTDIATLMAVHTAEQYCTVAALRRDAMRREQSRAAVSEMVDRSVRLELAAALRITEYAAGEMLSRATTLVDRFPQALDALFGARITDQHARFLVDLLGPADAKISSKLIDTAVRLAEELPAGAFRRKLRVLIDDLAAETLTERHERSVAERAVWVDPADDGMAYLTAYLPAVEAHAIFDRLTRMGKSIVGRDASPEHDDPRTLDQVRADVVCDLLIDGTCSGHAAATRGIRPTVVVTVPALSLLDDAHAAAHPATVEGLGPIPITAARELCGGSSRWMRVLTHPETGMVLSLGRTRYDPPPELMRLVRWRAERCMAPGCTMPASRCEIDHSVAWSDGGDTALGNLAPLCSGHHHVKHGGGWHLVQVPDSGGVLEWTSPYGRRYLVEPERRVPVFRPQPETAVNSTTATVADLQPATVWNPTWPTPTPPAMVRP